MPKLGKTVAKGVAESESSNRELVEDGIYVVDLKSVEVKTGKESKQPYWLWTFVIPDDAEKHVGKHFFVNTSLQDNALWKLKEVFDAFGETPDTDTDTLIGETVRVAVSVRPIGSGARKGEDSNQVENVLPLEPGEDEADGGAASGDDEPPF